MAKSVEKVTFKRFLVQLPEQTYNEVIEMAESSGVRRSSYLSMALVLGARILDRQLRPSRYVDQNGLGQGVVEAVKRWREEDPEGFEEFQNSLEGVSGSE